MRLTTLLVADGAGATPASGQWLNMVITISKYSAKLKVPLRNLSSHRKVQTSEYLAKNHPTAHPSLAAAVEAQKRYARPGAPGQQLWPYRNIIDDE